MTTLPPQGSTPPEVGRTAVMALCAQASRLELAQIAETLAPASVRDLRVPQVGLVMVRGRMGGDGASFNLGEATIARAAVEVAGIGVGHAYQFGRDLERARVAAIIDAFWQSPDRRSEVEALMRPVRDRLDGERARARRQTAATKVNFFTLARGED